MCGAPANATVGGAPTSISAVSAGGCPGYWIATNRGEVARFGSAAVHGAINFPLNAPIIATVSTTSGLGYWMLASDGGIFNFGDAAFYGSTGGRHLNAPIVGMATTASGHGYWLVASDGGIFTFGDAAFYGSAGSMRLNRPVVAMASSGQGYWLVASDGGIFAFGNAAFHGSTGGMHLNAPIVGISAPPAASGYRLVASDGGVFSFGSAPFFGSLGANSPSRPIVTMAPTPDGGGYYMLGSDGTVYPFGDAAALGNAVQSDALLVRQLATVGNAKQVVIVDAPNFGNRPAVLTTYQDDGHGWYQVSGPTTAQVGYNGWKLGTDRHEGDGSSPAGIYSFGTVIYGNNSDPGGLHYPYHRLVPGDYWDANPMTPQYNTFQHSANTNCGANPFGGDTECLWQQTQAYPYFAVINFNYPVVGPRGAGIFLHASKGSNTAGCVSVAVTDLVSILRWLNPAYNPVIVMAPDSVLRGY
ncbi:MAG: hypothetical protein NVSMB32_11570 [Actinomycetota bacterium]